MTRHKRSGGGGGGKIYDTGIPGTDGNTLHLLTKLNPPINDILTTFRQLRANHFD